MKNKRTARSSLKFLGAPVAALVLVLSTSLASAQEVGVVEMATGGYQATYAGATRTIEFAARRDASNNVKGQVQFKNLDTGTILHYDVTCLRIDGNIATMSGIAKTDSPLTATYPYFWLAVADNGEGQQATDSVSGFIAFASDPTCYIDPLVPDKPINVGNIKVM